MKLSLVIPLYNEEESLEQLHKEICEVAETNSYDLEIIFVDDGSTDQSWATIEKIAASDSRVRGIQFRRNFGKAAALQAGFNAVKGDFVLTLDADLQDDPYEIPNFLRQMETGFDVISGWKQRRHDPWHKVFPSRVFNGMVSYMTGVKLHDHNCGMKCYRREVVENVALYGERHRFIPVLAAAQGYKIGEKVVAHRARQFGHSKYGFARFIKGFLDMLTIWFLIKYGLRPQHLLVTV
jgi:dolichol-phosphate mannosyltransferase